MGKNEFQKDFSKAMDKLKKQMRVLTKNAGEAAKIGEGELVKATNVGRLQVDIMGLNLKKEKLYYELGKKIIGSAKAGESIEKAAKPFIDKISSIDADVGEKEREIATINNN